MSGSSRARTALGHLLARGVYDSGDVEELGQLFMRAFDVDGLSLVAGFGFDGSGLTCGVPEEWIEAHRRVIEQDPVPSWLSQSPAGSVYHVRGRPFDEVKENAVYKAFVRSELGDGAMALMNGPFGAPVFFAAYRHGKKRRFTGSQLVDFSFVQAPLERALSARTALAALSGEPLQGLLGSVELREDSVRFSADAERVFARILGGPLRGARKARVERALRFCVAAAQRGSRSRPLVAGLRVEIVARPGRPPSVLALLLEDEGLDVPRGPWEALLAPQQRKVARAAVRGLSNEQIADELGISLETVRTHLEQAYQTLGVRGRMGLVALALRA